jgi:hypothetical protein
MDRADWQAKDEARPTLCVENTLLTGCDTVLSYRTACDTHR